jgi:hypothetical protein
LSVHIKFERCDFISILFQTQRMELLSIDKRQMTPLNPHGDLIHPIVTNCDVRDSSWLVLTLHLLHIYYASHTLIFGIRVILSEVGSEQY